MDPRLTKEPAAGMAPMGTHAEDSMLRVDPHHGQQTQTYILGNFPSVLDSETPNFSYAVTNFEVESSDHD